MKLILPLATLLAMIAGAAMAQPKRGEGGSNIQLRMVIGGDTNIVSLAAIEAVQKDLGVGKDVAGKLTLLSNEYREASQKETEKAGINQTGFGKASDEQMQKIAEIRTRLHNEFIPKTTALLSPDQVKRLQQIRLQARMTNGSRAFIEPDVALELKLTNDQIESLDALRIEMREKQFPGGAPARGREGVERISKVREEYVAKAMEILTAAQKKKLGDEFPFPGNRP